MGIEWNFRLIVVIIKLVFFPRKCIRWKQGDWLSNEVIKGHDGCEFRETFQKRFHCVNEPVVVIQNIVMLFVHNPIASTVYEQ